MKSFSLTAADLDAVLRPFPEAVPLPACAYHDEAVFAREQATIFRRAWRCVGREEDVARPGDWLAAPLTPEGILVVRGHDLRLRAFYNVCQHRATRLRSARASIRSTWMRCCVGLSDLPAE